MIYKDVNKNLNCLPALPRFSTFILLLVFGLVACQPASSLSATAIPDPPQPSPAGVATGDTSTARVAFSNSFAENSFRQGTIDAFEKAATQAKAAGLLADFTIVSANGDPAQQAEQIQQMISEGYEAILINPASPTALNQVIKSACSAGIVVVVFDSQVTEPCVYTVTYVWANYGAVQGNYVGGRLNGQGNVLEVRGAKGSTSDTDISAATKAALSRFPDVKVVASVYAKWTQTIAQQEVAAILPSLPRIDAVVTQGGDGYGVALAFAATNRPMPVIIMGNRYDELKWWQEQRLKHNYHTISASATPGISALAMWTAQQILAGKEVPKFVEAPLLVIEEKNLATWLAVTPEGGVADGDYSLEYTVNLIDANINGTPLPAVPLPAQSSAALPSMPPVSWNDERCADV